MIYLKGHSSRTMPSVKNRIYFKIQIFILKQKVVIFSSACSIIVLLILLSLNFQQSPPDSKLLAMDPHETLAYTCCTALNVTNRTNVYFIKTHKTGSSTIQNVILRFAMKNSLDDMNIIYTTYYLPFSDWSIYSHTKTPNNKYHILAHHVRYTSALKSYQYPNTSTVTILRHPVTHFQSKYDFFALNEMTGMSLQQFLNTPKKPPILLGVDSLLAYRGYNQMSVDLGFDPSQTENKTAIAEFIKKIDEEFDLVMIMEHMEASMILLANLMGWPLEDVTYLKLNARLPNSDTYKLTIRDELTIMDLNEVDTLLYYHFRNKFLKCVRQYGEQKMNYRIRQLKTLNEQFVHRCANKEFKNGIWYGVPKTVEFTLKNQSDLECVYATANPIALEDVVRDVQFRRLRLQRSTQMK